MASEPKKSKASEPKRGQENCSSCEIKEFEKHFFSLSPVLRSLICEYVEVDFDIKCINDFNKLKLVESHFIYTAISINIRILGSDELLRRFAALRKDSLKINLILHVDGLKKEEYLSEEPGIWNGEELDSDDYGENENVILEKRSFCLLSKILEEACIIGFDFDPKYFDYLSSEHKTAAVSALSNAIKVNKSLLTLKLPVFLRDSYSDIITTLRELTLENALTDPFFIDLDLRNAMMDDLASWICNVLKLGKSLTKLQLFGSDYVLSFLPRVVISIASALHVNDSLTTLSLSDCKIDAASARSIADALKINKTLTALCLDKCTWDDHADTITVVDSFKVNKSVTSLSLAKNRIDEVLFGDSVGDVLKKNATLINLNLSFNEIGASSARSIGEALKENYSLTQLDLSYNNIEDSGVKCIAEALKVGNKTLKTLNLSGNNIEVSGIVSIADALKENVYLTTLDLRPKNIPKIAEILETVQGNTHLKNLNLAVVHENIRAGVFARDTPLDANSVGMLLRNNIPIRQLKLPTIEGDLCVIFEALKSNSTLTHLTLEFNADTSREDFAVRRLVEVALVGEALETNKCLKYLRFFPSFTYRSTSAFDFALSIADSLKVNKTLTTLSMPHCRISCSEASRFAEALKTNTTLEHLELHDNHIGFHGGMSFAEAFKINKTLKYLDLSHNNIHEKRIDSGELIISFDAVEALQDAEETNYGLQIELKSDPLK